ncbi:MAG: ATP-binding protein [Methanobrevibacter sp.]|uniref:NOP5/NOP56 family protein n=1 Tax=Methanobrevibacter sp. TaxID=66852 RepID=UPI0026E044C9|nr:ATP-binding protein [Methanobrevibacter sp.]MDO5848100.1 ATP-binding protein [Methanobrevibacter sp.]
MDCYITYFIGGFLAFKDNQDLIKIKPFPKDEIVSRMISLENKELVAEEIEIIEELENEFDNIIIESNKRTSDFKDFKNVEIKTPNLGGETLRENLDKYMDDFDMSKEEFIKYYRKLSLYKMKELSKSEDKHLIQAINSIDDIDEAISKLIERIREWYALYFPEMDMIRNNETYIKLISENKTKSKIIEAKPDAFLIDVDEFDDEDINQEDLDIINNYANSIYELQNTRKSIEKYIEMKMESIAPNLKALVGPTLGAKLISHAGGIKRLSTYPSSTVQIMGAEKALFRHLKSGDRPPKYGLIYQHPKVRGSKWWNRGKIARTLASRISLATRKDVYTKDIDPEIYEKFEQKVEEIEKANPFPTKTTKRRQEEKTKGRKKAKKGKKRKNKRRRK